MSGGLSDAARRELANPAPVGHRHAQIVRLVPMLRASGLTSADIFFRLRPIYDRMTLPDTEIFSVIAWAEKKIPAGFQGLIRPDRFFPNNLQKPFSPGQKGFFRRTKSPTGDFFRVINLFLAGFSLTESDLFDLSPVKLPNDFRKDAELTFESLYSPSEKLNLVTRFYRDKNPETPKAYPAGCGKTLSRNDWLNWFRKKTFPETQAGAWFRINPVNGKGISDVDISSFRFVLIESDLIPPEIQISLFAKFPIPICAIVKSGGKSIHAWVRIAATNAGQYRELVGNLFSFLSPFGFDCSNRNPSRLSRLPGAQRTIGATNDGKQRLLYLNPLATERSIA